MPANVDALTHGLSRLKGGASTPLDVQARDEQARAFITAKGGEAQVSALLRPQLVDLSQAVQLRDTAWAFIAVAGPWTRAGRERPATKLYLAASARAQQLAAQVGLAAVPAPVEDWSDIQREYANKRAAGHSAPSASEDAPVEHEPQAGGAQPDQDQEC